MDQHLTTIKNTLENLYDLQLNQTKLRNYYNCINDAIQYFPISTQQALMIKLLDEWKNQKKEKIVTVKTEVCHLKDGTCITTFGILSPDWPGLSNSCAGVLHEMGWNIYFIEGFSINEGKHNLGVVIIGVRTEKKDAYRQLLKQTKTILDKLHQAAVGSSAKAYLLSEEIRKLEIYGQVIANIENIYHENDLDEIIGMDGEVIRFFAARSRDYIENRKIEDIGQQIIRNFKFRKEVQKSGGAIQLDISNFTTKKEGIFTGVTVAGPAHLLNLEDSLQTIELTCPGFQLKHNREFTTNEGISCYRIEFVDHLGHPLSELEQKRLQKGFRTMVMDKRRDRAEWIEAIGGFEQYARAIIPLLVREAQSSHKTQVYQSVGTSTALYIDFKVIIVIPSSKKLEKNISTKTANSLESVPGLHILSVKPPRLFGIAQVFIIDLRASLSVIENIESIYKLIRDKIKSTMGDFRDFDEGMRTMDTQKLKSARRRLEGIDKSIIRELFYSIEDFYRIGASVDEVIDHIRIAYDMLQSLMETKKTIRFISRQTGIHSKSGQIVPKASLLCVAYPHELSLLQNILEILDSFDVTMSRLEKVGFDILICRLTDQEKALSKETLRKITNKIKKLDPLKTKKKS